MKGTIVTWKSDKGFGFIRPEDGSADVFVHIRDLGNISRPPQVGDTITYQPMKGEDGRLRAADAHISGLPRLPQPKAKVRADRGRRPDGGTLSKAVGVLLTVVLVLAAYSSLKPAPRLANATTVVHQTADSPDEQYRCAGKTYCSEMSSCAEAKYYLKHCPTMKMDGDGDGVPCESQWCNN